MAARTLTLWGMAVVAVAATACSSASSHPGSRPTTDDLAVTTQPPLGYRSPPSFLPTETTSVDRVVTATPQRPQLAVQGVGVQVQTPTARVLATVTGPHVPPFVSPPPPTVTATFDVSLAAATGDVPIRLSDFTITDQLGRSYHPTLAGPSLPREVDRGGTTTFQVSAVMPTGEGRIYWSPMSGRPVVGWDFVVEND